MAADNFAKFGESFQQSLARIILEDRSFSDQIGEVLDYSFFEMEYLSIFVRMVYDYKHRYKVHPSKTIAETLLKTELDDENELTQKTIWKFWEDMVLPEALDRKNDEYIKENSLDFARKMKVKDAMLKSIDLLQKVKFDEIQKIISDSLKAGAPADLGHLYIEDFEARYEENMRRAVSTGWPLIDQIMQGGLGEGELGAFIAATGVGKSFCLVQVGAAALQTLPAKKTVVHYTLELSDKIIGKRYDSLLSGFALDSLDHLKDDVFEKIKEMKNNLVIKHYNPNTASLITLENHLNRLTQMGHDIGMIIVDYADKLKPIEKRSERYMELEDTYEQLRGLAHDMKVPAWTASQSNRSGQYAELLTLESIAGAYAKAMPSDFIMTISRTLDECANNTGKSLIAKNRFGESNNVFPMFIDLAHSRLDVLSDDGVNGMDAASAQSEMSKKASGLQKEHLRDTYINMIKKKKKEKKDEE